MRRNLGGLVALLVLGCSGGFWSTPAAGQIVINEVLYDGVGADGNCDPFCMFTEIAGPPGTSLVGYSLVGVNGANGLVYSTINLTGAIGPSGFYVVATNLSVPNTDQVASVDWQNGNPDQVRLDFGTMIIDSVCYGGTTNLICEGGTSAPASGQGFAIGRDGLSTDTDDNAADFQVFAVATPGQPNELIKTIDPGIDLWYTPSASVVVGTPDLPPIPPGFFGPGSDPFTGIIQLAGQPLGNPLTDPADTIVERLAPAALAGVPSMDTIPVELVALNLVSTSPIMVTFNGGATSEQWDVRVCLSDAPQGPGTMTLAKNCADGGSFDSQLGVAYKLIFTPVLTGFPLVMDIGMTLGPVPMTLLSGEWTQRFPLDPHVNVIPPAPPGLQFDGNCDGLLDPPLPGGNLDFMAGVGVVPCNPIDPPGAQEQSTACHENPGGNHLHCVGPPRPAVPTKTILPGIDLWYTPSASVQVGTPTLPAFPPDFFGPGSDPFTGMINLIGEPLGNPATDPADAIVERLAPATLVGVPSAASVPIELVALNLVSTNPITVTFNGGTTSTLWDVRVCLSNCSQGPGVLTISKNCEDGGLFDSQLGVAYKLLFTEVAGPGVANIDPGCLIGPVPMTLLGGHWTQRFPLDPSINVVPPAPAGLQFDGNCDGVLDPPLPGGSPNFMPGISVLPCDPMTPPGGGAQQQVTGCHEGPSPDHEHCVGPPRPALTPCDPVTNLNALAIDCVADSVLLGWDPVLPGTALSFTVDRDGIPLAVLTPDTTAFLDAGPVGQGLHVYTVVIQCANGTSSAASVQVNVCAKARINEIRIDQPGADNDEYFELAGPPGSPLDGLTYLVLGDGSVAAGSGVIEAVAPLTGVIGASGFFVVAEGTFTLGVADLIASLNFENSDNLTHLLVAGFRGMNGQDLDTNDDGVLDVQPWAQVVDLVALILEQNPPTVTEFHYGPPTVGPDGTFVPGHVQRCLDVTGQWVYGPFDHLTGIDSPGAPNVCADCNTNGTPDLIEIQILGTGFDCNLNGILDECDLVFGTSTDCNLNGIPDECDPPADCNVNGIFDACEIADGSAQDCNLNGIPDACDIAGGTSLDCNLNGVPDECDLAGGTSLDCNVNGVPDECDIAGGTSLDCNSDGIPDECQGPDCNANGVPDDCDIAGGASLDCNLNGVPDECDIAGGSSLDCNTNGVPDECDIAGGTSLDCNTNGVPDECDIASGTSLDANGNGVPDECDPVVGQFVRGDCNVDATFNIADPIFLLSFLFPGGGSPPALSCNDACDCNDDGLLNIADAICSLSGLFGSPTIPPQPPHPGCGADPTPGDPLDCASFPPCI